MLVMTAKLSKKKLLGAAAVIVALIVVLVACVKGGSGDLSAANPAAQNDDRIAFLSSFGYTVNGEPAQTQQVRIPTEASEVFDRYNALQKSQGYDLSQYAGENVTRYVYLLENYDDSGKPWYATIFVYQGEIVGGDVACGEAGGAMHGFERPAS